MQRDQIVRFFQNPVLLAVTAAAVVLLIALIVVLVIWSRRRRREREAHVRSELVAMERETQFAAAAEQTQFDKSSSSVVGQVSALFQQYLSIPVLAVYAGREGDEHLTNILPGESDQPAGRGERELMALLPERAPSSLVGDYWRPQVVVLGSLVAGGPTATLDRADLPDLHDASEGVVSEEVVSEDIVSEAGAGRDDAPAPALRTRAAVLPWRGAFRWNGLIVARAQEGMDGESLARLVEPLTRLGNRLAVALELEQNQTELAAAEQRRARYLEFSRSLVTSLEEPSPLASIAREAARLVGAESAALWRVESDSSMVRMVAAYGLQSAEFLPLPVGQGLAGSVAASSQTLTLSDAPSDPKCLFPREARASGIISYLGVPLLSDGRAIGVIEAHKSNPSVWDDADTGALETAASLIASALRSADARGGRLKVESAYLGLSEALQRLRSHDDILEAAVEILGHALSVSRALIVEFNGQGKAEPVKHEYCAPNVKSALWITFPKEMVLRITSAATSEPIEVENSREQSLMGEELANRLQVLSELAIPMRTEGQTRAIIYLQQCDRTRQWQRDEVEFADRVGRQLSLSLANVKALNTAARGTEEAAGRMADLEKRINEFNRALSESRLAEAQARGMIEKAQAGEAQSRAALEAARDAEAKLRQERDRYKEDEERVRMSSKQLLEINRLKSEFIVNAGRELESSLQSILGFAEQLQQGTYGPLTDEQLQAVRGVYAWSRRMKNDIDWLVEYGSARSRRLDTGAGQ